MISLQKKRVNSDIFKNTGHFCRNTGFYRTSKKIQDITGNTGQLRGLPLPTAKRLRPNNATAGDSGQVR